MSAHQPDALQASYDQVAEEYTQNIAGELQHKARDRELLERFASRVDKTGLVCEIGCGPGHVARYLHERGVKVFGSDLSSKMVEQARLLNPGLEFRRGDMMSLEMPDHALAGIVAFYSIIHIPRAKVVLALRELGRVLRPGGLLFLAFHLGEGMLHRDEWWGKKVCVDFSFFRSDEMSGYLCEAGFEVEEIIEREPYPDVEHPSRRAYIFARRPSRNE
jgi:SAM-dependent methyltransferase